MNKILGGDAGFVSLAVCASEKGWQGEVGGSLSRLMPNRECAQGKIASRRLDGPNCPENSLFGRLTPARRLYLERSFSRHSTHVRLRDASEMLRPHPAH